MSPSMIYSGPHIRWNVIKDDQRVWIQNITTFKRLVSLTQYETKVETFVDRVRSVPYEVASFNLVFSRHQNKSVLHLGSRGQTPSVFFFFFWVSSFLSKNGLRTIYIRTVPSDVQRKPLFSFETLLLVTLGRIPHLSFLRLWKKNSNFRRKKRKKKKKKVHHSQLKVSDMSLSITVCCNWSSGLTLSNI